MYFELHETKRISMDCQAVCQHSPEMNHQCHGVLMIADSNISMHCELYETKTFSMDRVAGGSVSIHRNDPSMSWRADDFRQ